MIATSSRLCTFALFTRRSWRRSCLRDVSHSLFNIVLRISGGDDMIRRSSLRAFERGDDLNIDSDKIFSRLDWLRLLNADRSEFEVDAQSIRSRRCELNLILLETKFSSSFSQSSFSMTISEIYFCFSYFSLTWNLEELLENFDRDDDFDDETHSSLTRRTATLDNEILTFCVFRIFDAIRFRAFSWWSWFLYKFFSTWERDDSWCCKSSNRLICVFSCHKALDAKNQYAYC
jgi:hypothetical protein